MVYHDPITVSGINTPSYSSDLLIGLSTTHLYLDARDDVYFQRQKIRIEINCCEELVQCWVSCGWEVQGEAHQETVLLVSRAGRKQRNQRWMHQHSWSLAREEAAEFNGIFPSIFTKKHQFVSIKKEECGINLPFEGLSELMAGSENLFLAPVNWCQVTSQCIKMNDKVTYLSFKLLVTKVDFSTKNLIFHPLFRCLLFDDILSDLQSLQFKQFKMKNKSRCKIVQPLN